MNLLHIDIETYSDVPLAECGVYRYAASPAFRVLLLACAADDGPVQCFDLASGSAQLPPWLLDALTDPAVTKVAYNAAFERVCLGAMLGRRLDPAQWRCTMVEAARIGWPMGLEACARAMRLEQGKLEQGRDLVRRFCTPSPRTGRPCLPAEDPAGWDTFRAYCRRDVEVERAVAREVERTAGPVPDWERELYATDQDINDRGVLIDRRLAENACRIGADHRADLLREATARTGLTNPASAAQVKDWILHRTGTNFSALRRGDLDALLEALRPWPDAARVLRLHKELARTSTSKYAVMLRCASPDDDRVRGLLQLHGAVRTGRWAGRLVQVQNLPQNHLPDLARARAIVRDGDLAELSLGYADVTATLSELVRTAFISPPGCTLHVCDFSAIEARVVAWLAGEQWVLDVFSAGGDIYSATASQMFGVPVGKHGPNEQLRARGKVAVLALGYGGGTAALRAMGAERLGLSPSEQENIVRLWRGRNPRIVQLWHTLERAAVAVVRTGRPVTAPRGITFAMAPGGTLLVTLPSGRVIGYPRAEAGDAPSSTWDRPRYELSYEGLSQTTRRWERQRTYGGKLTENLVQAIARDILADVLLRARRRGMRVVLHIHDEIVVEAPPELTLDDVTALFSHTPAWAPGLPLAGAGYSTPYYLKD